MLCDQEMRRIPETLLQLICTHGEYAAFQKPYHGLHRT